MQHLGYNMSVKFISNSDGYTFLLDNKVIAEGAYSSTGFELLEDDDKIKVYPNAMGAFQALNRKYAGHLYTKVLSSRTHTLLRAIA